MTKDEALDLALDALDNLLYWDNGKSDYDQAREAITAIKQALAAPTVQEPVCAMCKSTHGKWSWMCGRCLLIHDKQPTAAQRPWVGLTKTVVGNHLRRHALGDQSTFRQGFKEGVAFAELKLKEKSK